MSKHSRADSGVRGGRLVKAPRYIFVQMKRRANHVTQTKTLPGPSAGWVNMFSPPLPGLSLNVIFKIKAPFMVKRCRVDARREWAVANETASVCFGGCGNSRGSGGGGGGIRADGGNFLPLKAKLAC